MCNNRPRAYGPPVLASLSFRKLMRVLDRAVRLGCVAVLAMVVTFHVCGCDPAQAADAPVSVKASMAQGGAEPLKLFEQCPACAIVMLPAAYASEQTVDVVRAIPAGTTLHSAPFSQPTVGPPPRA